MATSSALLVITPLLLLMSYYTYLPLLFLPFILSAIHCNEAFSNAALKIADVVASISAFRRAHDNAHQYTHLRHAGVRCIAHGSFCARYRFSIIDTGERHRPFVIN